MNAGPQLPPTRTFSIRFNSTSQFTDSQSRNCLHVSLTMSELRRKRKGSSRNQRLLSLLHPRYRTLTEILTLGYNPGTRKLNRPIKQDKTIQRTQMSSRLNTLTAVRAHLKKHPSSPHIPQLTSLIENGKNSPLKCIPRIKVLFGPTEDSFPNLGKKFSPFTALKEQPTLEVLRSMLLKEAKAASEEGEVVFVSRPFVEGDETFDREEAAKELIENLADPNYEGNGFVPSLLCPKLDVMTEKTKESVVGSMEVMAMACSVFPKNTLIPLQHHNETTSYSSLLAGSILWIVWPPTSHNLNLLHRAYDTFSVDKDEEKLNINAADQLVGGVIFVQSAGEGLRIPPYCLILGLATQTALMAKYCILSAPQFVSMLGKLPFLESWWEIEVDGDKKRNDFGRALLLRIQRVLAGSFESYPPAQFLTVGTKSGALHELVHSWQDLSNGIAKLVDVETAAGLKKIWVEFLINVAGRNCALCGRPLEDKVMEMTEHFGDVHWPGGESGTIDGGAMDVDN
jgi:hypothetical protein